MRRVIELAIDKVYYELDQSDDEKFIIYIGGSKSKEHQTRISSYLNIWAINNDIPQEDIMTLIKGAELLIRFKWDHQNLLFKLYHF